jgi:hypothetical protein
MSSSRNAEASREIRMPPKDLRGEKRRYVRSGSKFMATPLMQ